MRSPLTFTVKKAHPGGVPTFFVMHPAGFSVARFEGPRGDLLAELDAEHRSRTIRLACYKSGMSTALYVDLCRDAHDEALLACAEVDVES